MKATCVPEHSRFFGTLLAFGVLLTGLLFAALTVESASAQSYTVLHTFTGGADGGYPFAGLTPDGEGNFYGTTQYGGNVAGTCAPYGCGTIFKITHRNSSWILSTLYKFKGEEDGMQPQARVVFGPDGALYGTSAGGGSGCNPGSCGSIFRLQPSPTECAAVFCSWNVTILYQFNSDECFGGVTCTMGDLTFDSQANIYGTTVGGGSWGQGSVYELIHSGGVWTKNILYSFLITGPLRPDGLWPYGGVIFDAYGNLWGTTSLGGGPGQDDPGFGVIFELTPSGSRWNERIFQIEGEYPIAGLSLDHAGNFYGATEAGGSGDCQYDDYPYFQGCGTVFQGMGNTIYQFPTYYPSSLPGGPMAAVTFDAAGNIYGASVADGASDAGNVFTLSAGQFTYTSLYDFTGHADGKFPISSVVIDSSGSLFGTASTGGAPCQIASGCGVIWQIIP